MDGDSSPFFSRSLTPASVLDQDKAMNETLKILDPVRAQKLCDSPEIRD